MLLFLKLVVGHFLADFPLQGDFLAITKNHKNPTPGVPWYWSMLAHSIIQAGMVWFVTGNIWLAGAELVLHFIIDYQKCAGSISFGEDQAAHLVCKAAYAALML